MMKSGDPGGQKNPLSPKSTALKKTTKEFKPKSKMNLKINTQDQNDGFKDPNS